MGSQIILLSFIFTLQMRDSANIRLLGGWPFSVTYNIIPVSDSIIYVNAGWAAYIVDVSTPQTPVKLDSFTSPVWPGAPGSYSSITDTFLLSPEFKSGISLYNIAQQKSPRLISNYLTPDIPRGCTLAFPYAYVACYEAGLRIIDYSDPFHPRETGSLDLPYTTYDVEVKDSFAYVVNWLGGFNVINIANPARPELVFNHRLPRPAVSIAVKDTVALIAWYNSGLRLWNIANPRQPVEICSIPGSYARKVTIFNETLALAIEGGLPPKTRIFNIANPVSPRLIATVNRTGTSAVYHNRLFCITEDTLGRYFLDTLLVIDISDPANPEILGRMTGFHTHTEGIAVADSYVFTAPRYNGIMIYDAADPHQPRLCTHYAPEKRVKDILIHDTIAYVACNTAPGLMVLNVRDPENPELIATLDTPAGRLLLKDSLLFIGGNRLLIVNVADPANPVIISRIPRQRNQDFAGCAVYGNLLVTAEQDAGMRTFDISSPANPVFLGKCDTTASLERVEIRYPYAFFSGGYGLLVFDISDPANPVWLTYYLTPDYGYDFELEHNIAFVATGLDGVRAIDVSQTLMPVEVGYYITPTFACRLRVRNHRIYVADEEGWYILEYYGPGPGIGEVTEPGRSGCPLVYYLPGARKLGIKALPTHLVLEKIKIFNIAGGCVLSTSITTTNRNKEEFTIFPLNLQPGVYFVRLEPQALRAKLVVR
ncbi:MAG: hypothetical protein ABIJ93_03780 [candidate division WOR-3 bacterium]